MGKKMPKDRRTVEQIREAVKGKHAYTAVVTPKGFFLGRADFGERGYTPLKVAGYSSYEAAHEAAAEINKKLGLTPLEAAIIVADTMRPGGVA